MNKLQESIEDRSLSTRSLAAIVGINHMAINYYENEKRVFNATALKTPSIFFEVIIDYLLYHSSYYIFINYHNILLKVNEEGYKLLYKKWFIYFDNNKRYVNLNKLIGFNNNNDVVEIILNKEFIEYMKKAIEL
mgnify:CR=1 FL=1